MHNCYNGIGTWFYQAIGGLRIDESVPGYQHVFIDPQIPKGLTWAKMAKDTPSVSYTHLDVYKRQTYVIPLAHVRRPNAPRT